MFVKPIDPSIPQDPSATPLVDPFPANRLWLCLLLVTGFAFLLRFLTIDVRSLWLDEAWSAWFASKDWSYLLNEVPKFEVHPLFYYSLLKLWTGAFGETERALRMLSTLVNCATIPLVAAAAWHAGSLRNRGIAALLAALLFACSPTQIGAAQDARAYVFMTAGMALALLGAILVLRDSERAARPVGQLLRDDRAMLAALAALGAGVALIAWSHNLGLVFAALFGIGLLLSWGMVGRPWGLLINLALAALLALLLYLPNIPILLKQLGTMGSNGFWLTRPGLSRLVDTLAGLPMGYRPLGKLKPAVALLALAVVMGAWVLWRDGRDAAGRRATVLLLIAMLFGPTMALWVISQLAQPVFLARTLQASQVPAIILLSFAPFAWPAVSRFAAAAMAMGAIASLSIANRHFQPPHEPWREFALQAAAEPPGRMLVVVVQSEGEIPLLHYQRLLDLKMDMHVVTGSYPVRGPGYRYPSGGASAPAVEKAMIPPMLARAQGFDGIWLVHRSEPIFDPDGLVRSALAPHFPCTRRINPFVDRMERLRSDGSCPDDTTLSHP